MKTLSLTLQTKPPTNLTWPNKNRPISIILFISLMIRMSSEFKVVPRKFNKKLLNYKPWPSLTTNINWIILPSNLCPQIKTRIFIIPGSTQISQAHLFRKRKWRYGAINLICPAKLPLESQILAFQGRLISERLQVLWWRPIWAMVEAEEAKVKWAHKLMKLQWFCHFYRVKVSVWARP